MDPILLRPAVPTDAPVVRDFNLALALETEGLKLDPEIVLRGVGALLADPSKGRYFVAESGGTVIGQLMHTYEWSDWRNGMFWWLQSVYVLPEARGRGVFTSLFRHLEALAAADAGICGMRLYVERHNEKAQAVYRRLGLDSAGYEVFGSRDVCHG